MMWVSNVYAPVYRLLAQLGIPFRMGEENRENSLVVGAPYERAEKVWAEMMEAIDNYDPQENRRIRPVILINPFGGMREDKGYARNPGDVQDLRDHMHVLIESGFKIVRINKDEPGHD